MKSLRQAIHQAGFDMEPSRSVRSLAKRFGMSPPISILWLMKELTPDQIVWDTGWQTAGDVKATGQLGLLSTGFWSFKGEIKDDGDFFGDSYVFALAPKFADDSGGTIGFKRVGELEAGDERTFQDDGRNAWITQNWDAIKAGGFHWSLKASPEIEIGDLLEAALVGLVVAVVVWANASDDVECTWRVEGSEVVEHCVVKE